MDTPNQSTNPLLALHLTTCRCRRRAGGSKWRDRSQRRGEGSPRPGPDNVEPEGLRRGVGDISQIRADHKPLDAIQFCGASDKEADYVSPINSPASCRRRRLPSHKSTHDKLCSSAIAPLYRLPLAFPALASICAILSGLPQRESEKGD